MPYSINYITRGKVSSEIWPGDFAEAQELAKKAVESGGADRAEVRDAADQLVFHYPRITHRA